MAFRLPSPNHYTHQYWLVIRRWNLLISEEMLKISIKKIVELKSTCSPTTLALSENFNSLKWLDIFLKDGFFMSVFRIIFYTILEHKLLNPCCRYWPGWVLISYNGLPARYVKLRVAHVPGMPGNFFPPPRVSNPDMHQCMYVTHVPWCMLGSLTSGFVWSHWRGKSSRHSRCLRNLQFYVSGICDQQFVTPPGVAGFVSIENSYPESFVGNTYINWKLLNDCNKSFRSYIAIAHLCLTGCNILEVLNGIVRLRKFNQSIITPKLSKGCRKDMSPLWQPEKGPPQPGPQFHHIRNRSPSWSEISLSNISFSNINTI